MDFYRQNLIYSAGRYEIWEAGKCLDKGMCAVTIKAISSESKIKFIIEGAEHLPLSPIVTFFYQDPNAEILRDRIQYFDINNSGQTPSICNIFPSDDGEDITYIRFAVSGNVGYRIIEFYGQVLSVGEGVVDSSLSVTSSEKIIKQLRQTHSYTSEAIMQWAVDIFNANSDLGNEDTQGAIKKTDAIVEALKLFVEALKCDMKERDYDEQGPSLMYPKYCMFIASCNYKIGNYSQAYHVANKGLESMDEIMEKSVLKGFDKDFLGEKELQEIVDVIEDQNFEDIDWSIDSEDIDETEIDTSMYEELKSQLLSEPNSSSTSSQNSGKNSASNDRLKQLDESLMAQFTVSSMMGQSEGTKGLQLDENFSVAAFQQQSYDYCKRSKTLFATDVLKGMPGVSNIQIEVMNYYKSRIREILSDPGSRNNVCLKCFYEATDTDLLCMQIAHLTQAGTLKDIADMSSADKSITRTSLDPETVSIGIAIHVYFAILASPIYTDDDYDLLFETAWYKYYSGWMVYRIMLSMRGSSWRSDFRGTIMM